MKTVDVAIVGAGPAGLAAADAAISEGCRVSLVDDQATPGGQYFRQPLPLLGRTGADRFGTRVRTASRLLAVVEHPRVDYLPSTTVWNLPDPGVLAYAGAGDAGRIRFAASVVAAGAHDRCVAFPGWTLPGVITAGGAQNLLKGQRVLPGLRIAVVGNGPLLLVVAAYLARAGAKVVALAESAPVVRRLPGVLGGLLTMPGLITLAARYRARLLASGTAVLAGHTVVQARGQDQVEEVVLAPIDGQGRVDRGSARHLAVDTLVVGFGLQCSSELARLAGCDTGYRPLCGGWTPVRDPWMESSVPGLYLAGDGAAVGGAEMALAEGELAGLAAARRARGGLSVPGMRRAGAVTRRLARLGRFRVALQHLFAPPRSFAGLLTDDTVLCRCEDVDAGLLNRLCRQPGLDLPAIKARTRAGMGRCQGRNCLAALAQMLAEHRGVSAAALRWPGLRPPARPVPIASVLAEPMAPPALPEDPHLPRTRE